MMKKNILITGVSSGIGLATLNYFIKHKNYFVIGVLRDKKRLNHLKSQNDNLMLIEADFSRPTDLSNIFIELKKSGIESLDILINNAGVAIAAPFEHQSFDEITNMFNVNVLSLLKMTQLSIPLLKLSSEPVIINISSVSGVGGTPFLASYCATKHAVEGVSEALSRELNLWGIKVRVVGPGSIKTPIWNKGFKIIEKLYENTSYSLSFNKFIKFASQEEKKALPVEAVVADIIKATKYENAKYRYAPIPQKWKNVYLSSLIPKKIYNFLMIQALHLNPLKKTQNK